MKADPSRQQTSLVLQQLEDGQHEEYCEDGGIQGMKGAGDKEGPNKKCVFFFNRDVTRINKSSKSLHCAAFSGLRENFPSYSQGQTCAIISRRHPNTVPSNLGIKGTKARKPSTTEGVEIGRHEHCFLKIDIAQD